MSFALGLTGSIGMGKSTTAKLFADQGCDVWDADAAVHRLYSRGGAAVEEMRQAFPKAVIDDQVDRQVLKSILAGRPDALREIERIVHPLVARDRAEFRMNSKADIMVFDIPLLFETGGDAAMDAVACVSVDPETQKTRVLERGTMTEDQFAHIVAQQMPDAEKRARSEYVIVTDTLAHARLQVQQIVAEIREGMKHA
ncbi:dephospho-CoA kinase [Primorskyibacter sp. S87]|uniref:dephospho-CoA kinase n=1 Tax=Primorskyibacter sp. S87 TaxID=3415126 RepID=UPI003C7E1ADD